MKMIYGGVPVNSMKVKHYELNTNDCDMIASDLQAGKTAVARGKKITGTGKSFEFATYGALEVNIRRYVPNTINVVLVSSAVYPVRQLIDLNSQRDLDFSVFQHIADVVVDGITYPIMVIVSARFLTISCDQSVELEVFYGKDNYV